MGAGKSTIGRQLALALKLSFVDTDSEIERRCGADIPWIFDVEGESGFRAREAQVLEDVSQMNDCVIATGGGIVMQKRNQQLLHNTGYVVYLHATVEQQLARTSQDRKRPLLQVDDPAAALRQLMAVREPIYRQVADLVVDTGQRNIKKVAGEIAELINNS